MRLQKDEDGRVYVIDYSAVTDWETMAGHGPRGDRWNWFYFDSIYVPAKDHEQCDYTKDDIRWKKRYTNEQIEEMWNKQAEEDEINEYGISTA